MDFIPKDVQEAADKAGGAWIVGKEFESGLVLQIAKPMEKVKPNIPKYGAKADNYLVKNEILEEGQTFHYTFNTPEGTERVHDSNSPALFIALRQVEELGVGDWLKITRTGATTETRFTAEKVDAPSVSSRKEYDEKPEPDTNDPSQFPADGYDSVPF